MGANRIPLEVDAPVGPQALENLAGVLRQLGYDPRMSGREAGSRGLGRAVDPEITLKLAESIQPEASSELMRAVTAWIGQRPVRRGRFRHRTVPPVKVTISGPTGEQLAQQVVTRG